MAKVTTLRGNRASLLRALPSAIAGYTVLPKQVPLKDAKCGSCSYGFCVWHTIYWPIREDSLGHNLAISLDDPAKVSFAPKPEHRGDERKRTKLSFARYVRRYLEIDSTKIRDKDLAAIQARLIAGTRTEFDECVEILTGEDLRAAYRSAIGAGSCMTGADRSPLLDMYVCNPSSVGLAVFRPASKLTYRALLWSLDDGNKYLDRVYPSDGSAGISQFVKWAQLQGYVTYDGGDSHGKLLLVTMQNGDVAKYPYLDTFRYAKWLDKPAIRWRSASPDIRLETRRAEWPLYVEGNSLLDLQNQPVPCTRCGQRQSKEKIVTGKDGLPYCQDCIKLCSPPCAVCGEANWYTDMQEAINMTGRVFVCGACTKGIKPCKHCLENWVAKLIVEDSDMCPHCDAYCKKQVGK